MGSTARSRPAPPSPSLGAPHQVGLLAPASGDERPTRSGARDLQARAAAALDAAPFDATPSAEPFVRKAHPLVSLAFILATCGGFWAAVAFVFLRHG